MYIDPDYVKTRALELGSSVGKLTAPGGCMTAQTWSAIRHGRNITLQTIERIANGLKISARQKDKFLIWKFTDLEVSIEQELDEAVEIAPWNEQ